MHTRTHAHAHAHAHAHTRIINRMPGIAFAYDPDGYWVEIIKRTDNHNIKNYFNFSQTMLRIKDPSKSIPFYEAMGMTVVRSKNYGDFSN